LRRVGADLLRRPRFVRKRQEEENKMEKALTKLGNSDALVLDKILMELIGIGADSAVKLTVRGDEPIVPAARGSDGTRAKLVRVLDVPGKSGRGRKKSAAPNCRTPKFAA
jgi:antitoxin component of MazEF toxin-antitoxin module